jgi:hypothetical protein
MGVGTRVLTAALGFLLALATSHFGKDIQSVPIAFQDTNGITLF